MENAMTRLNFTNAAIVGAVVIATSTLATPVLAYPPVVQYPATCQSMYPNAQCRDRGPGNPGRYYGYVPPAVYNFGGPGYPPSSYAYYPGYRTGIGSLDFAGGAADAAIGTAGVIASTPFNSYAWERGYYRRY